MRFTPRILVSVLFASLTACGSVDAPDSAGTPTPTNGALPVIEAQDVHGLPGEIVTLTVILRTNGNTISGIENEIDFPPLFSVLRSSRDRPDCTVNSAIQKESTAFSFRPVGCRLDSCQALKALVLSVLNVDPIPDGAVLYTCRVAIPDNASPGPHLFRLRSGEASDPSGNAIALAVRNGTVFNDSPFTPRPTRTSTATPSPSLTHTITATSTPTQTPAADVPPVIEGGEVHGLPGEIVTLTVSLRTNGHRIQGTENRIFFPPGLTVQAKSNGRPNCAEVYDIALGAPSFAYHPPGCLQGECDSIRAVVLAVNQVDPLPNGAVLYRCQIEIPDAVASGPHVFRLSDGGAADPDGNAIEIAVRDGIVFIDSPPPPQSDLDHAD